MRLLTKKKQETPTINPIGPTDKSHRPRTKHYRKDSLGEDSLCCFLWATDV